MGSLSYDLHGNTESSWSSLVCLRDIWPTLEPDCNILLNRVLEQIEVLRRNEEIVEAVRYPLTGLAASTQKSYPALQNAVKDLYGDS